VDDIVKKKDKIFNSIPEFIRKLLDDLNECDGPIWFRGHANKDWKLQPSIARGAPRLTEITLIKRFKQNAMMLVNPRPNSSIEWLFVMRHHGVPTRLLDWTESALIAVYFAVYDLSKVDGCLWALLPNELNKLAKINDVPSFEENSEIGSYDPDVFYKETISKLSPMAIIAPRNNARMQAQLSVYTINHRDNTPFEELGDRKHVWRYIVPKESKKAILKELELIGIGKFQLFPELQSIGDILKGEC
jgi:hypothetical protein